MRRASSGGSLAVHAIARTTKAPSRVSRGPGTLFPILWMLVGSALVSSCDAKYRNFGPLPETTVESASPVADASTDADVSVPLCRDVVPCTGDSTCAASNCVECRTGGDCPASARICDPSTHECVACAADGDCPDTLPRCHPDNHTCEQCLDPAHCTAPTQCDLTTSRCTGCASNGDCNSSTGLCRTTDGVCVECLTSDTECANGTHCEVQSGACVECIDSATCLEAGAAHCERDANPATPASRFTCVACASDEDCAGKTGIGAFCHPSGTCVECRTNQACGADPLRPRCSDEGSCGPCAEDGDCTTVTGRQACRSDGASATCVECTNDEHCIGKPDTLRCATSPDSSTRTNTCVRCVENADCSNPEAPRCEQNVCVPCEGNADCHFPELGVCDTSRGAAACVECTGPQRQACGPFVCDSLRRDCSNNTVGAAGICDTCVSDAQCAAGSRCLPQTLQNVNVGAFCFPLQGTEACPRGFDQVATADTLDGQIADVCLQRATTCFAFNDYATLRSCQGEDDDDACGAPNVADGACVPVALSSSFACSINCEFNGDCPTGICTGVCPQ